MSISLGLASPSGSCGLPGTCAAGNRLSLLDLAPGGGYLAADIAAGAVVSYTTFSPLPDHSGGMSL